MDANTAQDGELIGLGRLLHEDICSDLVRWLHSGGDPKRFGAVRIDREYALGPEAGFADLRVEPDDGPPYFLEVKYGYDTDTLLRHLRRKYATPTAATAGATKVVLVAETAAHADWPALEAAIRASLPPGLALEVWDEAHLRALIADCFGDQIAPSATADLVAVRQAIDQGNERLAFGDRPAAGYEEQLLRQNLLWHFGTWRLRELRHLRGADDCTALVPPGVYDHVVALMADLAGFTRYVRDTADDAVVRQSLTAFYAKSRYQVIHAGGMLVQFVGDEIVALFGVPDRRPGYLEDAVRTATRLLDIGASVSREWQRKIDNLQPSRGVHVGMAMGKVQLVAMRALDHAHLAVIGDCLNVAKRLTDAAGQNEVVVSNVLHYALLASPFQFVEREPVEAKNLGLIRAWQLLPAAADTVAAPTGEAPR